MQRGDTPVRHTPTQRTRAVLQLQRKKDRGEATGPTVPTREHPHPPPQPAEHQQPSDSSAARYPPRSNAAMGPPLLRQGFEFKPVSTFFCARREALRHGHPPLEQTSDGGVAFQLGEGYYRLSHGTLVRKL